jgi:hypothetical protein
LAKEAFALAMELTRSGSRMELFDDHAVKTDHHRDRWLRLG